MGYCSFHKYIKSLGIANNDLATWLFNSKHIFWSSQLLCWCHYRYHNIITTPTMMLACQHCFQIKAHGTIWRHFPQFLKRKLKHWSLVVRVIDIFSFRPLLHSKIHKISRCYWLENVSITSLFYLQLSCPPNTHCEVSAIFNKINLRVLYKVGSSDHWVILLRAANSQDPMLNYCSNLTW